MNQDLERRRFTRVAFDGSVTLTQNDRTWPCQLIDISLKGALLEQLAPPPLADHEPMTLTLQLSDSSSIVMTVALAHRLHENVGLNCQQIDVESIGHLRKLIELNTGDPLAAERELRLLGEQP